MTELFPNISEEQREEAQFVFDIAIRGSKDPIHATQLLHSYTEYCKNPEEQEFISFFFRTKMEEYLNGTSINN